MLHRYFSAPPATALLPFSTRLFDLSSLYCQHWFDALGSGWVQVKHGMKARGLGGHVYGPHPKPNSFAQADWLRLYLDDNFIQSAKRAWGAIEQPYVPIDWQLDFKSGYRWDENTPTGEIPIPDIPGVDIKVPWELCRMQHLPTLAYTAILARETPEHNRSSQTYYREFRNQVLDFIAANPIGHGVNYRWTMDVAIRVANWLVAYDLFRPVMPKDPEFEALFVESIYEHGDYIVNNLENRGSGINNHYMSNLCGLIFVAAYLPSEKETDSWLALAANAFVAETLRQFHPDGSHFEGSTTYHCQVLEMVAFTTTLILALPRDRIRIEHPIESRLASALATPWHKPESNRIAFEIPDEFWGRLYKGREFLVHTLLPDGLTGQIGDGDSGRFVKLLNTFYASQLPDIQRDYRHLRDYRENFPTNTYWKEETRDYTTALVILDLLLKSEVSNTHYTADHWNLVSSIVSGHPDPHEIIANNELDTSRRPTGADPSFSIAHLQERFERAPTHLRHSSRQPCSISPESISLFQYPDFGLYVFRGTNLFLSIRCGYPGYGGHQHDDQLSIELWIDGLPVYQDPGTYVYTPLRQERNRYRSIVAHASPQIVGLEPAGTTQRIFGLDRDPDGRCLYLSKTDFAGSYRVDAYLVLRWIRIDGSNVEIKDWVETQAIASDCVFVSPGPHEKVALSPGYGERFAE